MKLLIVDDEQPARLGIRMIIENSGLSFEQILEAKSGQEALTLVMENQPEIVLMDIKMSGLDGLSATKEIKKISPGTEVIFLTAYALFDYAQEAVRCGARDYLLKPINQVELIRVLQDCLAHIETVQRDREKERLVQQELLRTKETIETELVWDLISGFKVSQQRLIKHLELIRPKEVNCWFNQQVLPDTCVVFGNITTQDSFHEHFQIIYNLIKEKLAPVIIAEVKDQLVALTGSHFDFNLMRKLRQDIIIKTGCSLAIGIGKCEESIDDFSEKYFKALEAYSWALCCDHEIVWQVRPDDFQYPKELFNALVAVNRKKAYAYIHKLLKKFPDNMEQIPRDILAGILTTAYLAVKNTGTDRWAAVSFFSLYAGQLSRLHSLTKIETWLYEVIEVAFELMNKVSLTRAQQIINQAIDFMKKNYHRQISLEEVARVVYLSPAYFSTLFKQQTGISFSQYLTRLRVDKAKELLDKTWLSISEISQAVGYTTVDYFCRIFKKMTGTTPSNYRRE